MRKARATLDERDIAENLLPFHYGLTRVNLTRLDSERDLCFRVRSGTATYFLKITGPDEAKRAKLEWRVLAYIGRRDEHVPMPSVVTTTGGDPFVPLFGGSIMYLTSWLSGIPLDEAFPADLNWDDYGSTIGRVTAALEGLHLPELEPPTRWDLARLPGQALASAHCTPEVAESARRFAAVEQIATALPRQLVHGDLHFGNVLVDEQDPRITGIVDTGDVHWGMRAIDIAIALSYVASDPSLDPDVLSIVQDGYDRTCRLTGEEVAVVPTLVIARLAQRYLDYRASPRRATTLRDPQAVHDALARML